MGTFTVKMGSVNTRSNPAATPWVTLASTPTEATGAQIITEISDSNDATGTATLYVVGAGRFGLHELMLNPDDQNIVLDTGTVTYAGLPVGFEVTALTLNIRIKAALGGPWSFDLRDSLTAIPKSISAAPNVLENITYNFPVVPTNLATFYGEYGFQKTISVDPDTFTIAEFYLTGTYTVGTEQWYVETTTQDLGDQTVTLQQFKQFEPGDEEDGYAQYLDGDTAPALVWWTYPSTDWWTYQVVTPGTGWATGVGPDPHGWWYSPEQFGGSIITVADGRPKAPRDFLKISTWATGSTGALGGSPASSCVSANRLIYPAWNYTVGTDYPPIRIYDGSFDRELCRLPPTSAGAIPKGVMSMLAANGTIYVSTYDSGTSSADWAGRVFELDVNSGKLTPIGAAFTGGHMPYALAWHNGMLWCGTHKQSHAASGKVYFIRPNIDTAWTDDYTVSSSSMAGVACLFGHHGSLYVGCSSASGTFAKVLVRATDGTYSTSLTGSGGTAATGNTFLALTSWDDTDLYATFWNHDATPISKIYKLASGSWTAVFTSASSAERRPLFGLFEDHDSLFALGGGMGLTALLLWTDDGATWDDLTDRLPETDKTAIPVFGILVL